MYIQPGLMHAKVFIEPGSIQWRVRLSFSFEMSALAVITPILWFYISTSHNQSRQKKHTQLYLGNTDAAWFLRRWAVPKVCPFVFYKIASLFCCIFTTRLVACKGALFGVRSLLPRKTSTRRSRVAAARLVARKGALSSVSAGVGYELTEPFA